MSVVADRCSHSVAARLLVPQRIVDNAQLAGRFSGEVDMMGVFVQVNETHTKGRWVGHLIGYVVQESGCWEWVGRIHKEGYGIWRARGRPALAHRKMYETHRGPIPKGLVIDHLCRNKICVNPDHLEAVTDRVNILRGSGGSAINAQKTSCHRGHPFSARNTYRWHEDGARYCRVCRRDSQRRFIERKRARS